MNDDRRTTNEIEVEPIFDEMEFDEIGTYDATAELDEMPNEVLNKDVIAAVAPKTTHWSELMNEIHYYTDRGTSLLGRLYNTTFVNGIHIRTRLTVPGVWEVGETANYEVRAYNNTGFDLKDVKVSLIAQDYKSASIVSPPGSYLKLGDINYKYNKTTNFKVKAMKSGDVLLNLRIDSLMGDYKRIMYYSGWYWNGTKWVRKHPYSVKHHIY